MSEPTPSAGPPAPQRLTPTHWLILVIAAIGFGFDIYQLLMMQYIGPSSLRELMPDATPSDYRNWRGMLFFVPAFAGGIFGMLGGYLTDLWGRRRVLTGSILIYAFSAFAAGFSTSVEMLLFFRCLTFIGVCVEFVAAVAWLAELFPAPMQRERALGYTQAFSSLGGLSVSVVFLLLNRWASDLPAVVLPAFITDRFGEIANPHAVWRYILISGVIPAFPLLVIRPFLPESPIWAQKKLAGTLKRPSFAALFAPDLLRTTVVSTLMFACSYGAAFGAIQQLPFMVPALPEFKTQAEELKQREPDEKKRKAEEAALSREMAGKYGTVQEVGGLIGRFVLALLAVRILSRRSLLRVFLIPGLLIIPFVFAYGVEHNRTLLTLPFGEHPPAITLLHVGIFLTGLFTVAQFSFWGNYLPTAYPVHLRGTGESVAANIGGRMLGTSFAMVTSQLAGLSFMPGQGDALKMAFAAAGVGLFVYLSGTILCAFLPEPKAEGETED